MTDGTTVSTHILDTSAGRPAGGVAVELAIRSPGGTWDRFAASSTDPDGRCKDFPELPEGTRDVRLHFAVAPYFARGRRPAGFFPEVTVAFTVQPGEHHHVPLLLNPFGYSVYRGS